MSNAQASTVDDLDGGTADSTQLPTSHRWWILVLVQISTLTFGIAVTSTARADVRVEQIVGIAGGPETSTNLIRGQSALRDLLPQHRDEIRPRLEQALRLIGRRQLLGMHDATGAEARDGKDGGPDETGNAIQQDGHPKAGKRARWKDGAGESTPIDQASERPLRSRQEPGSASRHL